MADDLRHARHNDKAQSPYANGPQDDPAPLAHTGPSWLVHTQDETDRSGRDAKPEKHLGGVLHEDELIVRHLDEPPVIKKASGKLRRPRLIHALGI